MQYQGVDERDKGPRDERLLDSRKFERTVPEVVDAAEAHIMGHIRTAELNRTRWPSSVGPGGRIRRNTHPMGSLFRSTHGYRLCNCSAACFPASELGSILTAFSNAAFACARNSTAFAFSPWSFASLASV